MEILKNILDVINEYYHVFIIIICVGLFVLNVVKPSKKADLVRVLDLVNKAEELFPDSGSGASKLAYVISKCSDLDPSRVVDLVNQILDSPERKN